MAGMEEKGHSEKRRLAVIDTNFPWKRSGFRYWESMEILKQRPETLFFATKMYRDAFPAKVHDFSEFKVMAEKEGITDVYCVFLNHTLSLAGDAMLPDGTWIPGANPDVNIGQFLKERGIRLHSMIYPGGGLSPNTSLEFLHNAARKCSSIFTNIQEVRAELPESRYFPIGINTDFYSPGAKKNADRIVLTFCAYKAIRKGFELLADVFNQLDERYFLNIIGDWQNELHLLTNPNFKFHYMLDPEEIKKVYGQTQCFIYCGTKDHMSLDGFPTTSACDAMSAGCLLISTNPRKDKAIFRNQEHYLEIEATESSILDRLKWIETHFDQAMEIARNGSARVKEKFDVRNIVKEKLSLMLD